MGWPTIEDYRTALQHPEKVFRDPRLQGCKTEMNRMGVPKGRAGAFAIVYRLSNSSWSTAVRVFLNPPKPDRQKRYQMVHEHLQKTRPGCLVDFLYDPGGILIGGNWFPILTLEWVDGEQLGEWVRGAVARGDKVGLKRMADNWVKLVCELRTHNIAHGDLQHGNVMVRGDKPVLVDYDCMFVPAMVSDADREPWENGLPGYQHPERTGQLLSPDLDNFSAWVILIALRAIADDFNLFHTYTANNDNLLFTDDDLHQPGRSKIWDYLLKNTRDSMVLEAVKKLRASLDAPFDKIPPFNIDIFGPIRDIIATGDWRQIHELATSGKYANENFPPDVLPQVQEAIKRVECLAQLEQKLKTGRAREIAAAYRPELLDDWVDAAILKRARAAKQAVELLAELARAEQSDLTGRRLIALWDKCAPELAGMPEGDEFRKKVDVWKQRIAAVEKLDQAVKAATSEKAVAAAWKAVADLGGHPDADRHRDRAEVAGRRVDSLVGLANLPRGEDEKSDRALLSGWLNVEKVLDGCVEADAYRARVKAAKQRMRCLEDLKRKIAEADAGRGSEHDVVAAADRLPAGYGGDQLQRVTHARQRIAATEELTRALAARPQSDLAIATAAERARQNGTWPADPSIEVRCELAIARRDRLAELDRIPRNLPIDEADAKWSVLWDGSLLDACHDARNHSSRYELAVSRITAYAELERALAVGNAVDVKRLSRDALLADHPGVARNRKAIDELIATSERVERLERAARSGQAQAFLAEAEPEILARHESTFRPHSPRIVAWIEDRLRNGNVLRKAIPEFDPAARPGTAVARWGWGDANLVRTCLVASDPHRFYEKPEEARGGLAQLIPETHRAGGGAVLPLPRDCQRLYVTVWPVVNLQWVQITGPPLKIGPHIVAAASSHGSRGSSGSRGKVKGRRGPQPRTLGERIKNWILDFINK